MPPVGLEPAIPAGERSQTHALDRAATGTDNIYIYKTSSENINTERHVTETVIAEGVTL